MGKGRAKGCLASPPSDPKQGASLSQPVPATEAAEQQQPAVAVQSSAELSLLSSPRLWHAGGLRVTNLNIQRHFSLEPVQQQHRLGWWPGGETQLPAHVLNPPPPPTLSRISFASAYAAAANSFKGMEACPRSLPQQPAPPRVTGKSSREQQQQHVSFAVDPAVLQQLPPDLVQLLPLAQLDPDLDPSVDAPLYWHIPRKPRSRQAVKHRQAQLQTAWQLLMQEDPMQEDPAAERRISSSSDPPAPSAPAPAQLSILLLPPSAALDQQGLYTPTTLPQAAGSGPQAMEGVCQLQQAHQAGRAQHMCSHCSNEKEEQRSPSPVQHNAARNGQPAQLSVQPGVCASPQGPPNCSPTAQPPLPNCCLDPMEVDEQQDEGHEGTLVSHSTGEQGQGQRQRADQGGGEAAGVCPLLHKQRHPHASPTQQASDVSTQHSLQYNNGSGNGLCTGTSPEHLASDLSPSAAHPGSHLHSHSHSSPDSHPDSHFQQQGEGDLLVPVPMRQQPCGAHRGQQGPLQGLLRGMEVAMDTEEAGHSGGEDCD